MMEDFREDLFATPEARCDDFDRRNSLGEVPFIMLLLRQLTRVVYI